MITRPRYNATVCGAAGSAHNALPAGRKSAVPFCASARLTARSRALDGGQCKGRFYVID